MSNTSPLRQYLKANKARTSTNVSVGKGSSLVRGVELLRTYCNRNETTRQVDGLVAEARGQIGSTALKRSSQPPRAARLGKKLPADIEEKILEGYRAGRTVYEIAGEHGIHRVTASVVLKRAGVTMRRNPPSEEQVKEMIRLYNQGLSLQKIGDRLGFDASTVLNKLRSRGVRTRDSHGRIR